MRMSRALCGKSIPHWRSVIDTTHRANGWHQIVYMENNDGKKLKAMFDALTPNY